MWTTHLALLIVSVLLTGFSPVHSQESLQPIENPTSNLTDEQIEAANDCFCVIYYLCDADNYIITDGKSLFDIRLSGNRILCAGAKACCKKRPNNTTVITKDNRPGDATSTIFKEKKIKKCGLQLPTFEIRILTDGVDGSNSIPGEFPWIASIFKKDASKYSFKCSGSLIHPQVILTANHCASRKTQHDIKIVVNGLNELKNVGDNPENERDVWDVVRHPDFYSGGLYNDIALVFLRTAYNISDLKSPINSICLPTQEQSFQDVRCIVAGYGKNTQNESKVLKRVEVPIVERSKCEQMLQRTRLGSQFDLHSSFLCAGGEKGRDACQGDGGSPLMCKVGNDYVQAGIVSWGIGCGKADVPGLYTDVAQFRTWINTELENKNLTL